MALELNPAYDPAWNNLGLSLEEAGQLEAALEAYAKAIEYEPRQPTYHLNRAQALSRCGRRDEAVVHMARALELDPELRKVLTVIDELRPLLSDPRLAARPDSRSG